MAGQVQVGGVSVDTQTPNPFGSTLSGIATGADWAIKNAELQNKREALQAEMQKHQVEALKVKMEIGQKVHDRMRTVARLPFGTTKKAEIKNLEEQMGQLGLTLSNTARGLLEDKNYAQDLGTVLDGLDSQDAATRVQSMAALPYLLSDDQIIKWFESKRQEAGKDRRAIVQAVGQAGRQKAQIDANATLQAQKETAEKERQAVKIEADKQRQAEELRFKRQELSEKMALDRQKLSEAVLKEVQGDTSKAFNDFKEVFESIDTIREFSKNPNAVGDQAILGAAQTLAEKKSSVLRETDVKRLGSVGGVFDNLRGKISNWQGTGTLGPNARQEFGRFADQIDSAYRSAYLDLLSPSIERVKAKGLNPSEAFTADQLRMLGAAGIFKGASSSMQKAREDALKEKRMKKPTGKPEAKGGESGDYTAPPASPNPYPNGPPPAKVITLDETKLGIVRKLLGQGVPYSEIKGRIGGEINSNQKKILGIKE